jgi:GNAT superfamily N-acetyltransferase
MIPFPLTRVNRLRLASAFAGRRRVDISLDCILEDQMGTAFVDDPARPTLIRVAQGPFNYIVGSADHPAAADMLAPLPDWTMFFDVPAGWPALLQRVFGTRLAAMTRYMFAEDDLASDHLQALLDGSAHRAAIQPLTAALLETAAADAPWLETDPYDSPADFEARGVGFCLLDGGRIQAAAWASLVCSHAIEVSIFVNDAWRRQGVATALGAALALASLEQGRTPHWDAANEPSCGLAERLGYRPVGTYAAFYIEPQS